MKLFMIASRLLVGAILCAKFASPQETNIQQLIDEEPELVYDVPQAEGDAPIRSLVEEAEDEIQENELSLIEFVRRSRNRDVDHSVRGRRRRRLDGDDDDDGGKGKGKGYSGDDDDDGGKGKGKGSPTRKPTKQPTKRPTKRPTKNPTKRPSKKPTVSTQLIEIATLIDIMALNKNACIASFPKAQARGRTQ